MAKIQGAHGNFSQIKNKIELFSVETASCSFWTEGTWEGRRILRREGGYSFPRWGLRLAGIRIKVAFPFKMGRLSPGARKASSRVTQPGSGRGRGGLGSPDTSPSRHPLYGGLGAEDEVTQGHKVNTKPCVQAALAHGPCPPGPSLQAQSFTDRKGWGGGTLPYFSPLKDPFPVSVIGNMSS